MRIALFSPYVCKHAGGGEKHLLDIAEELSKNHEVVVATPLHDGIDLGLWKNKYTELFNTHLDTVSFVFTPLGTQAPFFSKLRWTAQFDYLYAVTDGSLFFSLAHKNNLHIQIPFSHKKNSFLDRLKLMNWHVKNTNSQFTKAVIEKSWGTSIDVVHYPLVDAEELKTNAKKKNSILSVGRFFKQLHSKRQDILIEAFKYFYASNSVSRDWKLILVGSVEDEEYFLELKQRAHGFPIEFMTNISRKSLVSLYKEASFYWHAAGYEIDELLYPEQVEHFGIATIEAMAAGAIPIVVSKGGQVEILAQYAQRLGWSNPKECASKTLDLLDNKQELSRLRELVKERAHDFGRDKFRQTLAKMI